MKFFEIDIWIKSECVFRGHQLTNCNDSQEAARSKISSVDFQNLYLKSENSSWILKDRYYPLSSVYVRRFLTISITCQLGCTFLYNLHNCWVRIVFQIAASQNWYVCIVRGVGGWILFSEIIKRMKFNEIHHIRLFHITARRYSDWYTLLW